MTWHCIAHYIHLPLQPPQSRGKLSPEAHSTPVIQAQTEQFPPPRWTIFHMPNHVANNAHQIHVTVQIHKSSNQTALRELKSVHLLS